MDRPSLVTRFFMSIVAWAEQLNLALSKVGNPAIYDNKVFPWARSIENEWRAIRAELAKVPYMLVVGDREAESGTAALRRHKEGDVGTLGLDEIAGRLTEEAASGYTGSH